MGVFYQVVVPLLEMKNAALIGISTPSDSTNFYSELTELRDETGETIFNVFKVGMICDECKGKPNEQDCPHRTQDIPPWKSQTKRGVAKAIFGDKVSTFKRESLGMISDDERAAFESAWVRAFINRPRYALRAIDQPKYMFVACDPSGGGESFMTLVSAFYLNGKWIVSQSVSQSGIEPANLKPLRDAGSDKVAQVRHGSAATQHLLHQFRQATRHKLAKRVGTHFGRAVVSERHKVVANRLFDVEHVEQERQLLGVHATVVETIPIQV